MNNNQNIVIVGADGFVGGFLADLLHGQRIVYRPPHDDEIHIQQAEKTLKTADVIINAGGFRVRPGLNYDDYRRSHVESTAALMPYIQKKAKYIHISSTAVLGKIPDQVLDHTAPPQPERFPSPPYAKAKAEADQLVYEKALERGFQLVSLLPSVIYDDRGEGMVGSLIRLAKRGIILRLFPRKDHFHLCYMELFAGVVQRVVEKADLPPITRFIVADPEPFTYRELEDLIRLKLKRHAITLPLFVKSLSFALRHTIRSKNPIFDLVTWGEIVGVINLNTIYDTSHTFDILGIDPNQYRRDKILEPLIAEALQE